MSTRQILLMLFVILFLGACLIGLQKTNASEIVEKQKLSLRGRVADSQLFDLRDQRCFETLNNCQKLLTRIQPESEREVELIKENNMLRRQIEVQNKIIDCYKNNTSNQVLECLKRLSGG